MSGRKMIMTFTVAECGEFHSMGEYHENIKTLEEAVAIYHRIPPERMNGIPSLGINLHTVGTDKWEDSQIDVLTGDEIDMGLLKFMPEFCENPEVREAVKEIIKRFPDKEVIEY